MTHRFVDSIAFDDVQDDAIGIEVCESIAGHLLIRTVNEEGVMCSILIDRSDVNVLAAFLSKFKD
jgi:hypothetical protein